MNLSRYANSGTFLKAADLQGREVTVEIDRVRIAELDDATEKIALGFRGKQREMLCNSTNASVLLEAFGEQSEGWLGRRIVLFPTRVQFKGQVVDALRVRIPAQPHQAPRPAPPPAAPAPPPPPPAPAGEGFDNSDDVPF